MRILGISGSLRAGSLNTRLLQSAGRELPEGVDLVLLDVLREVPPYDEDVDGDHQPAAVEALRSAVRDADALLISTPEYNSSIPGALKNALDWLSRPYGASPLSFTPVAVMGATTGSFGAVWAQAELRKVLAASGARVVEGGIALGRAHEAFGADGELADPGRRQELGELLGRLVGEGAVRPVAA